VMTAWMPAVERLDEPENPAALQDLVPLLKRLVAAFGASTVAALLGVNRSMVTRWRSGRSRISEEMGERIINLHDIFTRAFQVFRPNIAVMWLMGSEPFLNGARPLDVLVTRGAAPLIEALGGIDSGGYA
jgi:uncharacterized protein (DUF2384 family)